MIAQRAIAAAACTASLSIQTVALAADDPDCRTIALLANPQGDLSKLGLQVRKDGLIDLAISGKSDVLTGAENCDLWGPADEFSIECKWAAESQGAALAKFNFLRVNLDLCLPAKTTERISSYSSATYRVLRSFESSIELESDEDYLETAMTLNLVEYTPQDGAPQYSVTLEFSR